MSDDLVKRARDCANGLGDTKTDRGDLGIFDDLADRIEELEKRVNTFSEGWRIADEGRIEAEAKLSESEALLAKAVEALEFYATLIGEKHECPWHMLSDDFGEKARTTLAELTGDKDE